MTADFWKHIQPQLNEQIRDVLGDAQDDQSLYEILDGKYYWWMQYPFEGMKFRFENADQTFLQWANCCEGFYGDPKIVQIFEDEFKKRIRATIEYQWEIRMKEGQDKLDHELKEVA